MAHFTPVRVAHNVPESLAHYDPVEVVHYTPVCSRSAMDYEFHGSSTIGFLGTKYDVSIFPFRTECLQG
jgi:hypothetical protein